MFANCHDRIANVRQCLDKAFCRVCYINHEWNAPILIACTRANCILIVFTVQIEEAGKFKPLEVDLKRLEDMSDAIVQDFAATRKREEEMRSTNGNQRIKIKMSRSNHDLLMKMYVSISQSQPTTVCCSSAYSACAAYWDWPPGKCSTCDDISKRRNSSIKRAITMYFSSLQLVNFLLTI